MYSIKATAVCNIGKLRKNNEDNLLFHGNILEKDHEGIIGEWKHSPVNTSDLHMYGVFDGMGGHSKGEYASYVSALTAQKAEEFLKEGTRSEIAVLKDICKMANRIICKKAKEKLIITGSTLSILIIKDNQCWSCNLGDSPIYRIRDNEMIALFEEHSERRINEILYGKDKVKGKNYPLTQYVGVPEDELRLEPYIQCDGIRQGDIYLLCSDGLTDMVSEEWIRKIISSNDKIENKIKVLEQGALDNGGKDNITIIGVEVL